MTDLARALMRPDPTAGSGETRRPTSPPAAVSNIWRRVRGSMGGSRSGGPVLAGHTGYALKVAEVTSDDGPAVFERDGGDAQVHLPDIQFLSLQLLNAGHRRFGVGQDSPSCQIQDAIGQTPIRLCSLRRALCLANQRIPPGQLLLDADHRDRQLLGRTGINTLTDRLLALPVQRQNIRVEDEQTHGDS